MLWIFSLHGLFVSSQSHSSKDNYTGAWESPGSWDPVWALPNTIISDGSKITINGYITVNSSLLFSSIASNLTINDTLVIKGNLTLRNNNDLTINDNGLLIVMGDFFSIYNQTNVVANGYLIVTGSIIKEGSEIQGKFTSNDNPALAFFGGTTPPAFYNNPAFPVLNCPAMAPGISYPNSICSFGNMEDLINDPIYPFFQNLCETTNVNTSNSVCTADTIYLTSAYGKEFSWKGPSGFFSLLQNPYIPNADTYMSGEYIVKVTIVSGCTDTDTTDVIVNEPPVVNAGPDQVLKFITETEMEAELSSSETGEWSLVSGSGIISDIHSPTTKVTELSGGENIFLWIVRNLYCESGEEIKITVYDPLLPSVITPDGDGKNDYFIIGEPDSRTELIIFNRWGNIEYRNSNYLNDWDGRNNSGAELPYDTYFYILNFENGVRKKGSVLIKR